VSCPVLIVCWYVCELLTVWCFLWSRLHMLWLVVVMLCVMRLSFLRNSLPHKFFVVLITANSGFYMQNVCTCFHYLMVNADSRHSSLARRPLKQQSQFYVSCHVLIVLSLFSAAFRPFVSELKYAKCSKHCQSVSSVMSFAWSENACQLNIGRIMIFLQFTGWVYT